MKRVLFLKYLFSWENELFVPLFCRFLKAKIYLFTISVEHKGNVDQGYSVYRWLDGKAVMQSFLSFTSLWVIMVDMGESIGHRVWSPMRLFPYDILKSNQISSENICKRLDMHLENVVGLYAG